MSNLTFRLGERMKVLRPCNDRYAVFKTRGYEVIALTTHFGFRDLLTSKLGQDH